jgi:hypothetical protein
MSEDCRRLGEKMLRLIDRLEVLPDERRVYGMTSHFSLCLLAEHDYLSPTFVVITPSVLQRYDIEYLMPERLAPWPHAYVKGVASSVDEAVEMVLIAMEKSEGWREPG